MYIGVPKDLEKDLELLFNLCSIDFVKNDGINNLLSIHWWRNDIPKNIINEYFIPIDNKEKITTLLYFISTYFDEAMWSYYVSDELEKILRNNKM